MQARLKMRACFILVALLYFCGPVFSQECVREVLENVDFPGTDLVQLFSPDVAHCQLLCTQHPSCLFFTFVRADWTTDDKHFYCYLKSTPSGQPNVQKPLLGVTSGYSLKLCSPDSELCLSQVYENVDFYGADYKTLFTPDYEECQRACTHDPSCQFFTFVNGFFTPENIKYKCHLKFSWSVPRTPIVDAKPGVISGFSHYSPIIQSFKTECQAKLFPNTDIPGSDFESLPAGSPEHCHNLCSAHPLCTYFSYDSDTFKCFLKNNPNETVTATKNGVTSGIPARFCVRDNSWVKVAHEGIDFQGSDIRFVLLDEAETCQTTCTQDPNCQFYAYATENFSDPVYRRRCYLKRTITMPSPPKVSKLANVVSGFSQRNC